MGGSKSKQPAKEPEVKQTVVQKVYVHADRDEAAKQALMQCQLENKRKELQAEVQSFKQQFLKEDVIKTVATKEDVLILQYKELEDTAKILGNINELFEGFPGTDFILETAKKFVMAMRSTDELKNILRWQSNKVIRKVDGQAIGVEVHYKVNIMEDTKKTGILKLSEEKETTVMVAYKTLAHLMDVPAEQIPSWDKLKSIKF